MSKSSFWVSASFSVVDDEFVTVVEDGAGAGVVGVGDGGVMVDAEIAGEEAGHLLDERGGAFLEFGVEIGLVFGFALRLVAPEADGGGAFGHAAVDEGFEADAVERAVGEGLADYVADGGKHVAGDGVDVGSAGPGDSGGPFDDAGGRGRRLRKWCL